MNSAIPKPLSIPIYVNNGRGRDTYISFSNGGFSNYRYSRSYKKDYYEVPHYKNHPDLSKRRPIDKYPLDGKGRDFFIFKNILSEHDKGGGGFVNFSKSLRTGEGIGDIRRTRDMSPCRFERNLINRIFYGKCPGMKDRQMSPKVKFKNDFEQSKSIIDNNPNNSNNFNNSINSETETPVNEDNFPNILRVYTESNDFNKKSEDFQNNSKRQMTLDNNDQNNSPKKHRNFPSFYRPNKINREDDFMNSVKKIFMYNKSTKVSENN